MARSKSFLASYLKQKRINLGLSQDQVAQMLGYSSPQFVSNWERGMSPPPYKNLHKLAKIYQLDSEEVIAMILKAEEDNLRKIFKSQSKRSK